MINLPDEIKIGCDIYRIVQWKDSSDHRSSDYLGRCDRQAKIIYLDIARRGNEIFNTLLHEILHAAYYYMDISKDCEEEKAVNLLANCLSSIVMDNPQLLGQLDSLIYKKPQEVQNVTTE
jgi:hypothetical protein